MPWCAAAEASKKWAKCAHFLDASAAYEIDCKVAVLDYKCYMKQHRRTLLMNTACRGGHRRLTSTSFSISSTITAWSFAVRDCQLTISDRAFPVAATHVWNDLPHHVTSALFLSTFYTVV